MCADSANVEPVWIKYVNTNIQGRSEICVSGTKADRHKHQCKQSVVLRFFFYPHYRLTCCGVYNRGLDPVSHVTKKRGNIRTINDG